MSSMWVSLVPGPIHQPCTGQYRANYVIDHANDKIAWIFTAPDATPIDKLSIYAHTVSSPPVYKLSVNALDTSTFLKPDLATEHCSGTFTPSTGRNTVTMSSAYTPTAGKAYAVVLQYSSGTISGSQDMSCRYAYTVYGYGHVSGQTTSNGGTSWTKYGQVGSIGILDSSSNVIAGNMIDDGNTATVNAAANYITANRIRLDSTSVSGAKTLKGFTFPLTTSTTPYTNTWKFCLWDSAGTELEQGNVSALENAAFSNTTGTEIYIRLDSPYELAADTDYYLGVESVTGTANVQTVEYTWADNVSMAADCPGLIGNSDDIYKSVHNGTSWTDSTEKRIPMALEFSAEASGGGGGGLLRHAGMNGGLNG